MAKAVTPAQAQADRAHRRIFYGWYIVAAGAVLNIFQSALLGQAYGSYVVLLREEFGWSKKLLSAASSLREAESGIMGPVQGTLLDRFGPRRVARVGCIVMGIGFMLFSQVQNPWQFYGAFFVMSIGGSMMGYMTITFAAVNWFEAKRSTAIAMTSAGFAIGGIVVPITTFALEQFGWRPTAFASGVIIIVVGLPLTQLFRHHPHEMGLLPDGARLADQTDDMRAARAAADASDFTLREAMHTPAFWLISLGHASALVIVSSMSVHLVSHLTESQGYSLGEAARVVTLMTTLFLVGTISGGFVGDRVSKRKLLVTCMAMHATGLLLLSHATNLPMIVAFTLLHGLAWGWRGPQMAAIRADYFGRTSFGKILGVSNMIIIVGSISGPFLAGFMYDQTGNYRVGFDMLAAIAATGSIFFILARRPAPPTRLTAAG